MTILRCNACHGLYESFVTPKGIALICERCYRLWELLTIEEEMAS